MNRTTYQQFVAVAAVLAVAWGVFGALRFDQGLDLSSQGRWVFGASLEANGSAVHATIDTGDGPLPYLVLGSWMRLFGQSFLAAAHVQLVLHLVLAVLVGLWTRRYGWGALILGQFALLAAVPLPFAGLWAGIALLFGITLPERARPGLVSGLLLAGSITLDAAWLLFATLAATLLHRGRLRPLLQGFGIGVAVIFAQALASGAVGPTLTNALVGPWSNLADGGIGRVFSTLASGAWLELPFAPLATGETPGPAWPAHAVLRSSGLRLLGAVVLSSPFVLWWKTRASRETGLAAAAAMLLLLRGDIVGITAAGAICGISWAVASVPRRSPFVIVVVLALLVPAAENAWLVARSGRPQLERWESPRVGVRLDAGRATSLQSMIRELHLHTGERALIWPDLAGLHFLFRSTPLVPDLGPGNDARTAQALRDEAEPIVLLSPRRDLLPQHLERSHPLTTTELRRNFRLRGSMLAGGLNLRAFQRGTSDDDPLAARLPRIEAIVATSVQDLSPSLRDDLAIGQSFRLEGDDLQGFALRLVTTADSVPVRLRARLWEKPGSEYNSLLAARTLEVVARRDRPMHWFEFPVSDTAGRNLALVFEAMETPRGEVRFAWNEDAGIGDIYPYGSAMLDLDEVDADLVILIY